jgi:hypothetical protein
MAVVDRVEKFSKIDVQDPVTCYCDLVVRRGLSVKADRSVFAFQLIVFVSPRDVNVMCQIREGHVWAVPSAFRDPLDSLPVAGPSSTGRDSNPSSSYERFQSIVPLPPLLSFVAQLCRLPRQLQAASKRSSRPVSACDP